MRKVSETTGSCLAAPAATPEAIDRCGKGPGGFGQRGLDEEPPARRAVQRMINEAADELTQDGHPLGRMMVMAAPNCSVVAESIQRALVKRRALGASMMQTKDGMPRASLSASVEMAMRSWPAAEGPARRPAKKRAIAVL